MSNYDTILYEVDKNLTTITLNRPDQLNGITNQLMRELYERLNHVSMDPEIRVVVFSGTGRGFCPGVDLTQATRSCLASNVLRRSELHYCFKR